MTLITGMFAALSIYIGIVIATLFGWPFLQTVETVYMTFLALLVLIPLFALVRWLWNRPVPASELLTDIAAHEDLALQARIAVASTVRSMANMMGEAMSDTTGIEHKYLRYILNPDAPVVRLEYAFGGFGEQPRQSVDVPLEVFDRGMKGQRQFIEDTLKVAA